MARLRIADLEVERHEEPFEVEFDDGEVFVFHHPNSIGADKLIEFEGLSVAEQVKAVLGSRADDFLPRVDGYQFDAIVRQYFAHFGVDLPGEGVASPRSLNRTARRSKPTSRRKA